MCGITGFVGKGDSETLKKMTHALSHRGMDGSGYYIDEKQQVYLGHRRLAIIDLKDGQQPMWNHEGTIGVIFNGEIYNHFELREQLIQLGAVFKTHHSDTEVLIQGYRYWGDDLPIRLNGMFAFVIYDKLRKRIFMARDRFGQKPLYYTHQNSLFAFASEIKALVKHPDYNRQLNKLALQKFMAYGYLPAPHCHYQQTYKLAGGHQLVFDILQQKITIKAYWKFQIEPNNQLFQVSEQNLAEELRHLLKQSVKRCLMSDVPLGILLSGGIDSSSLLALASQLRPAKSLLTYNMGFEEKSYDESYYAKMMADYVGSTHHQQILSLDKYKALIPTILQNLDEPLADASLLPTYLISKFASQQVKVILSGDGGDELFAGYAPFKALRIAQFYAHIMPKPLHKILCKFISKLPVSPKNMSIDFKIKRTLMGLSYPMQVWNPIWMSPLDPNTLGILFNEKIDVEELYSEAIALWTQTSSDNLIDKTLEYFTILYLQDDILTKVDRASMMVSVESRAPFLDNDLVEFTRKLPHSFKYQHGQTKYLLKKAMSPLLPKSIIKRPKKGFGIPLNQWLREISPIFFQQSLSYCNQSIVSRLWKEHCNNTYDHKLFLWSWLVAQHIAR